MSSTQVTLIPGIDNPDNHKVTVNRKAAELSELIKSMLTEDDEDENPEIPLLQVSKRALDKIVEFMNKHESDPMRQITKPVSTGNMVEIVGEWDANYIDVPQAQLLELTYAADYLDMPALLDLTTLKMASLLKGKTEDQTRELFGIKQIKTPEEEKRIIKENPWLFAL